MSDITLSKSQYIDRCGQFVKSRSGQSPAQGSRLRHQRAVATDARIRPDFPQQDQAVAAEGHPRPMIHLVEQMLKHRIPGLRQRVLTLGYHPAHARRPTFRAEGSAAWFRDVLDLVRENGAEVRTLRDVYHACDEAVRLESSGR